MVFRQAEALLRRGHNVWVVSPEPYPAWFDGEVPFRMGDVGRPDLPRDCDRIIGTSPAIINALATIPSFRNRLWHLVQGYEGDALEGRPFLKMIEAAYSLPVPKMTVSESLTVRLKTLYPDGRFWTVGQGVETTYFHPARGGGHIPGPAPAVERIIMVGPITISYKQIGLGLTALRKVRVRLPRLRLVRISTVDTRAQEEAIVGPIDEYHVHLLPWEVGREFRKGNSVVFSPSGPGEGFGLPALEALASGLPAVLTRIPSYESFASPCDYAAFVPPDDAGAMAAGICALVGNERERERLVRRGLEVASRFSYERVAERVEACLLNE